VLTYDTALETVPTNIVGGLFNFKEKAYFEVEEPAAREAPRVQF
jgi:LemA protein